MFNKIILASKSEIRAEILKNHGFNFEVIPSNVDEDQVKKSLQDKGIFIKSLTRDGVVEETPEAYKNVDSVVNVSHELGIATKVAKLIPIGVIKG